eukprot:9471285-Lingulodinium_polyedra.AAC.1
MDGVGRGVGLLLCPPLEAAWGGVAILRGKRMGMAKVVAVEAPVWSWAGLSLLISRALPEEKCAWCARRLRMALISQETTWPSGG